MYLSTTRGLHDACKDTITVKVHQTHVLMNGFVTIAR